MCGIAGIASLTGAGVDRASVRAMCDAMVHRGPNSGGMYLAPGVGLGMRRLSIIDLQTGDQPVGNEDGSIWVVLNGEIYNFRELRRDLTRRGHTFSTTGDTETIVHLYEEHGIRCVDRLRGMFAFALWDGRARQLLLARDRIGIKPLYYTVAEGRLIFASELKAILRLPEVERALNWRAVDHLFTFLATPASDSIIDGVRKLEPAHVLVASQGRDPRIERYWELRFEPDYGRSEAYFVDQLRALVEESVGLHLASDVPLGAFLSGGIDSSAVVASMARLTTEPVKTFSIGFADAEYDESSHARSVAKQLGTDHHELILEPNALEVLEDLAWFLDEPFGDASAIPTYMVSRLAAEHVTVVLSGDGGDELFGGYDKYVVESRERAYRVPAPVRGVLALASGAMPDGMRGRNFLHHFSLAGAERYLDAVTLFRRDAMRRLFRDDVFTALSAFDPRSENVQHLTRPNGDWLSALQYLDVKNYLPLDILTKVDRMSMAHSIEARVPLLDHVLVEFAATIPPGLKLNGRTTKYIFKRAMRGILPDTVIDRPKHGFAVPLARWFRGQLGPFVRDLLLSKTSRQRGIFNPEYIERLLAQLDRGRNLDLHLWTLISFEMWCRTFLDPTTASRSDVAGDSAYSVSTPGRGRISSTPFPAATSIG
ncbi:MAG TPA: asparagine synthase (glutamine-hydrolyzing) [Vicinamibacterales bacterium]|nr:asparagine synthase (glutamine-hydrolyzing) [Vicinamibacterales bacterium]